MRSKVMRSKVFFFRRSRVQENDHEIKSYEIKSIFFSGDLENERTFMGSKDSIIFNNFDQEIESC